MSTPAPTPVFVNSNHEGNINRDISKPVSVDSACKDLTPPPSPLQVQDSITVLMEGERLPKQKWGWWQGYQKDRTMLGFEAPPDENVVMVAKKGQKRRNREDD